MPEETKEKGLSLQELRAIIHSLKMNALVFLEPEVIEQIQALIKELPSPETLGKLEGNEKALKQVKDMVGYIMSLIDYYGTKGKEFKVRYKSIRKLPPRYKVVEWRDACTKQIVKMSKTADDKNLGYLSERLLNIVTGDINDDFVIEIKDTIKDMNNAGLNEEAWDLYKMAQAFNSTMIVQNPGQPTDPGADLTNLNEAKRAFAYFSELVNKLNEIKVPLTDIEKMLDVGGLNLVQQVEQSVKSAMAQTKAFSFLSHMKKLTSVDDVFNESFLSQQLSLINNSEIPGISKQQAQQAQQAGQNT